MKLVTLIKFGELEHLEEFRNQGLIYMNPLPYFWNVEEDEVRNDPFDCAVEMHRGTEGSVIVDKGKASEHRIQITKWDYKVHPPNPEYINLFCMYGLSKCNGLIHIDPKNFEFGTHALVFHQPQQFIDRVKRYMEINRIDGTFNLVEYVDDNYIGDVGPYKKRRKYSYQSEWRMVWQGGGGCVRKPTIGSIKDISTILPVKDLVKEIRIQP